MDLWLQITLCVLGGMFLLLLIHTSVGRGIETSLTIVRKGELLGLGCSQKLEKEALKALQEKQQFYMVKTELTDTDRGVLAGLNYAQGLLQAVINGNQKLIDDIKEDLNK